MNGAAARFVRLGVSLALLVTLGWVLTGHSAKATKKRVSLPTDWSHHHLIFTQPSTDAEFARVSRDPRFWQQMYRRQGRVLPVTNADQSGLLETALRGAGKKLQRDWAVSLGTGASVGAKDYPAKFSFDINTANCTNDFVIFSTGLQGSSGQAAIVAFNNLYSGCGGTVPNTYWAYDTTGAGNTPGIILTSPVTSLDGTQVAFVQTDGLGHGFVVLLKWAANNGSIDGPVKPTLAGSYSTCTAPCMAQFDLRTRKNVQTDDITSSVYYDYGNDVAWVGDSLGFLHKFHPFFAGVPAEIKDATWPLQVNSGNPVTNPVFDSVSNDVFLGDAGGFLYAVDATSGNTVPSGKLDFGTGFVEGPIVDSNHQLVYAFASSDGTTSACAPVACSAVYQLSTTFGATSTGSKAIVGSSVVFPGGIPNPMYYGGFDSAYYSSTDATGSLYVCGNTGSAASLYQIPISVGLFPASGLLISRLTSTATSTAPCSGVTDIPNPNTTGGPSERLFVSVQTDGRPANCGTGKGCIMNFVDTPWKPSTAYAVGQQVLSSALHIETVITAGTSGANPPIWTTAAGGKVTESGGLTWIDGGVLRAFTLANWQSNHAYATNSARIIDTNGNVEVSTTPGTSGGTQPTWPTTPGATVQDGTGTTIVTWTNAGPVANVAMQSTGGTSGIIEDNVVSSSTLGGTSQIYFTTLKDQTCGTSGTGGCAIQAAQPSLK